MCAAATTCADVLGQSSASCPHRVEGGGQGWRVGGCTEEGGGSYCLCLGSCKSRPLGKSNSYFKASKSHHLPGAAQDRRPGRVLHVGVGLHHDPSDGPR